MENTNGTIQRGDLVLRKLLCNRGKKGLHKICTGLETLDEIIEDILGEDDSLDGKIIEICGKMKSGKTQLCYHLVSHITFNYSIETLYIDTKNDFMMWRFKNILINCGWTPTDITKLLNNVRYENVHEPEKLIHMLHELNTNMYKHFAKLKLIVLDSLPSIILQYGQNENNYKRKLILEITQLLRSIAYRYQIIIFVTNFTKYFVEDSVPNCKRWMSHNHKNTLYLQEQAEFEHAEFHYAVTKLWLFQPNFRIILEICKNHDDDDNRGVGLKCEKRLVIFRDVHTLKTNYKCYIQIDANGVQSWRPPQIKYDR